ncbi:HAD family hydrolase [Streptomyces enissocaesilis]|uniref:HAD family hydrolase n=1 Tax=Streptomyces enissocaesilis TaxID=332589 RepID=A0ABN3XBY5_9ACTN
MRIDAEALLFDNDGTLLSSMESVIRCWTRWAQEYGISAEEFAAVELHGRPAAEIVADLLPADTVPGAVARIEELEVEDVAGGVVILPGTAELLASLSSPGLPASPGRTGEQAGEREGERGGAPMRWAVVTSASRRLAEARLAEAGIHPATLIAADDITRGKPDPEPFLLAARRLGVDPARCVVFEDAPAGLRAGRAAGMRTVALATTHDRSRLVADIVVENLSAVSLQATGGGVEIDTGD